MLRRRQVPTLRQRKRRAPVENGKCRCSVKIKRRELELLEHPAKRGRFAEFRDSGAPDGRRLARRKEGAYPQ